MNDDKRFWDLFLAGDVEAESVHDFVDTWHSADTTLSVYTFLGCSEEQYAILVRYPENAEEIRTNSDPAFALALLKSLQPWSEYG